MKGSYTTAHAPWAGKHGRKPGSPEERAPHFDELSSDDGIRIYVLGRLTGLDWISLA